MNRLESLPRSAVSIEDLVERAESLVPELRARAEATELARMVPRETMDRLFELELLSYFLPRRYGGHELPWGTQTAIGRVLAGACASTSWIACVVGSHSAYVARMAPEAQDDVWGDGPVLIATGSVARNVSVQPVEGGFRVSGRWSFCSGIDHAAWTLFRGTPAGDRRQHYLLMPRSDFTIEDDWYVSGMSGTGSKSALIEDVFVPTYRSLALNILMDPDPPGARVNKGSVYSYNFRPFAGSALLGPILGGAEGALAEYRSLLNSGVLDITDVRVQLLYAESAAEIGAAGQLVQSIIARQQFYASTSANVPHADRVALTRDRTFSARLCFNAVERLMTSLPQDLFFLDAPIQRHFRDLAAMVQQIGVNWDRNMISCVRASFGMDCDIPWLNSESGSSQ
jgi:alkylation response protein AidB-like acyl-CoA dehydrogenase